MKFIFLRNYVRAIVSTLLIGVTACTASQQSVLPKKDPNSTEANTSSNSTQLSVNLVALSLVKKDNLTGEFSAEIYPLALMLNGHYVEISNDVTQDLSNNASPNRILELNNQRIILNAIKEFTIISNHQKLGKFQVEKPIVSQFACSSIITGQGKFVELALQAVFDQIPEERSNRSYGYIRDQQFDQTRRTAIAVSQLTSLSKQPVVAEADRARYQQDLLTLGKAAIAQVASETVIPGEAVVESIQVVDLDRDHSPEVFGAIKQGTGTQAPSSQPIPTGFASIWLTYRDGKPQALETTEAAVSLSDSQRSPYKLLETLDLNGDGIDEVIVERTGYEYLRFEIYQYQNDRLERVFSGSGYGC